LKLKGDQKCGKSRDFSSLIRRRRPKRKTYSGQRKGKKGSLNDILSDGSKRLESSEPERDNSSPRLLQTQVLRCEGEPSKEKERALEHKGGVWGACPWRKKIRLLEEKKDARHHLGGGKGGHKTTGAGETSIGKGKRCPSPGRGCSNRRGRKPTRTGRRHPRTCKTASGKNLGEGNDRLHPPL